MGCILLAGGIGAACSYPVLGLNPYVGAALAATVQLVNVVTKAIYLQLKERHKDHTPAWKAIIQPSTYILEGYLLSGILKACNSTLPLFHAFAFAQTCAHLAEMIVTYSKEDKHVGAI